MIFERRDLGFSGTQSLVAHGIDPKYRNLQGPKGTQESPAEIFKGVMKHRSTPGCHVEILVSEVPKFPGCTRLASSSVL